MRLKSVRDRDLLRLSTVIEWLGLFCLLYERKRKSYLFSVLHLLLFSVMRNIKGCAKKKKKKREGKNGKKSVFSLS